MDGKHYLGKLDEHYHVITAGCGFHVTDEDDGFEIAGCISTADARLIAASPDLLEALEDLVDRPTLGARDRAIEAIAKAKGEQA